MPYRNPTSPGTRAVSDMTRGLSLPRMPLSGLLGPGQGQSSQMERAFMDATSRGQNIAPLVSRGQFGMRRRNQPISQQAAMANFQSTLRDAGVMFPGAQSPQRVSGQMMMPPPQMAQQATAGRPGMGRGGGQLPMRSTSQNPYV
jgi:hypothetical protein